MESIFKSVIIGSALKNQIKQTPKKYQGSNIGWSKYP